VRLSDRIGSAMKTAHVFAQRTGSTKTLRKLVPAEDAPFTKAAPPIVPRKSRACWCGRVIAPGCVHVNADRDPVCCVSWKFGGLSAQHTRPDGAP
jgi:hypothetical protein